MEFKVKVTRKTDWKDVLNAARQTVGKGHLHKEPSDNFKKSILLAEHSPIRELIYEVTLQDVPYFVVMHLVRHNIGINWFVKTSREDRTGVKREERRQTDLVDCSFSANAQAFINISKLRLCSRADKDTRAVWQGVIDALREIDPILASVCVPNCIYRGFCTEGEKGCNNCRTDAYEQRLKEYRNK